MSRFTSCEMVRSRFAVCCSVDLLYCFAADVSTAISTSSLLTFLSAVAIVHCLLRRTFTPLGSVLRNFFVKSGAKEVKARASVELEYSSVLLGDFRISVTLITLLVGSTLFFLHFVVSNDRTQPCTCVISLGMHLTRLQTSETPRQHRSTSPNQSTWHFRSVGSMP